MQGTPGGSTGADNAFASHWGPGIGAEIMGRNKFGPQRGAWADEDWKGWWGDDPPFHTPVFVLTHHPRPSITMQGGTTFHFINASPGSAGGRTQGRRRPGHPHRRRTSTVRQFLAADLIDHLHIVVVPIVLGRGERLWDGLEDLEQRFDVETVAPRAASHMYVHATMRQPAGRLLTSRSRTRACSRR